MPSELGSERRTIVSLNFLNHEGKMVPDFLEKVDGGLGVVVVVDSQYAESGRFVNGRKLVEALASSSHNPDSNAILNPRGFKKKNNKGRSHLVREHFSPKKTPL
jgi:hypothetical protein